jgi:serine/threonine-protein kinase RsbW
VTYVDKEPLIPREQMLRPAAPGEAPMLSIQLQAEASTMVIPTIRTVAADLAARADFDVDAIDDLRMAVDDACAMLVRIAAPGAPLSCRFTVRPERIEVSVEVDVDDVRDPLPTGSFSWRVLECLTDEVSAVVLPSSCGQRGRVCITLAKDAVTAQRP